MGNVIEPGTHDRVLRALGDREIRLTPGRRRVLEELQRSSGPQAASELHQAMRGEIPLSSVYRSLAVLDEAGVLQRQHDAEGLARYELADWLAGHHHHLICITCSRVEDVELDEVTEHQLTEITQKIAAAAGYRLADHVLEVEGECGSCTRD